MSADDPLAAVRAEDLAILPRKAMGAEPEALANAHRAAADVLFWGEGTALTSATPEALRAEYLAALAPKPAPPPMYSISSVAALWPGHIRRKP